MPQKRRKSKGYPWDDWLSRSRLRLVQGRHFNCLAHSMVVQIRNAASSRGKSVSIRAKTHLGQTVLTVKVA